MPDMEDVSAWVGRDLLRFCKDGVDFMELDCTGGVLRLAIYTDTNRYSITAKEEIPPRSSYLGCIANSRKPRAGETWTRGRDLADGPLSEETWRRILADIVSYEMVRVHKPEVGNRSVVPAV